ncbi:hypothetical protein [Coprobacillus sp. AF33-1AC]|uniref:hypothetical protein n=1 Tax=Coprobacillus sp. AF33-1AC TaxID=2292032 RepID=UPI000E547BF1|nr:hypothetical protein [Coprobacillus sp. AF33-1AC]RHM59642.1 hypothetical protein DWZ53_08845 [Coprobacillus sp. AF33-1AC]
MGKLVDKDGNEINKDTLLWNGKSVTYLHTVTLSDDALKFKSLIIIINDRSVEVPIINGSIKNGGIVADYRCISVDIQSYNQGSKQLSFVGSLWTDSKTNSNTTLTEIYGRY